MYLNATTMSELPLSFTEYNNLPLFVVKQLFEHQNKLMQDKISSIKAQT